MEDCLSTYIWEKKYHFLKIFKKHKTVTAIIYINANLKNSKFTVYVF